MLVNQAGRVCKIEEVESFGFKGWEHFANCRGYVWSRSIPLLKKTLLIGFGPDNFVVKFPNHDYLGKLRFLPQGIKLLFDKPHNLYLQIALNTGVLSLLAVLILVGVYLYDSAILYRQHPPYGFAPTAGLGIAMAVVAYMVAGIFNDSMVGVAPVFWSLLGLGIAANRINSSSIDGAAISGISHSMPGIIKPRRKQPLSSKKSLFQRRRGAQRC